MSYNTCLRCNNNFYTAYSFNGVTCPFCGFNIKVAENEDRTEHRLEDRSVILRQCELSAGVHKFQATTVDLSRSGVCVKITGACHLEKEEVLNIVIRDFEIESDARLVWVKRYNDVMCKVGFRFLSGL